MGIVDIIFGTHPVPLPTISEPPQGVHWRKVHCKPGTIVKANLATKTGSIRSSYGRMRYRAGSDYILERDNGERSVVSRGVFERTYAHRLDGRWEKRTDIIYRYFTLPRAAMIATAEGLERADAGDWIMQGVDQELWPVKPEIAAQIYDAANENTARLGFEAEREAAKGMSD